MPEVAASAARKTRIPWSQETRAIVGVGAAVIGVFLTVALSLNNRITAERNALTAEILAEHADIRAAMRAEHTDIRAEMRAEHADIRAEMRAEHADIRQTIQIEARKTQEILREILRLHTSP